MHRLTEKLTALEYAVAFLLEREERKLMAKTTHTQEDLQDSARLEDLRAELQLHMTEKPEPVDIMCPLCRKVELVPEVPIIGLNPDPVRPLICDTCADNIRADYAEQMEEEAPDAPSL
jgi:hypothetical protein